MRMVVITTGGTSLRDRWKTAAPLAMGTSPTAASGVSQENMQVIPGRTRPNAPRTSATQINRRKAEENGTPLVSLHRRSARNRTSRQHAKDAKASATCATQRNVLMVVSPFCLRSGTHEAPAVLLQKRLSGQT